jgi:hypothetical protein
MRTMNKDKLDIDQAALEACKPYFGSMERAIEDALRWQRIHQETVEACRRLGDIKNRKKT